MNYWIFQAVPERYDLQDEKILKEGQTVTWYATRYRSRMSPDDVVVLWLAGPKEIRGIWGMGRLTSSPYIRPEWKSYGVDVKYEQRLKSHVSVTEITSTPALQDLLILRAPMATNFLLSPEEARTLAELIEPDQRPEVD